jgi:hypothetical protein
MLTRDLPGSKRECCRLELGMSTLCARRPEDCLRFPAWARDFSLRHPTIGTVWVQLSLVFNGYWGFFPWEKGGRSVNLTAYLQLVPKVKKD